jgi:hypothetical protein
MKAVVKVLIVIAALLVVSTMAFAQCTGDQELCYSVTAVPDTGSPANATWKVCLNNSGYGQLCEIGGGCFNLDSFGGGPSWYNLNGDPAFGGKPMWNEWIGSFYTGVNSGASFHLQPMGAGGVLLTGVASYRIPGPGPLRFTIKGQKVSMSQCEVMP